MSIKINTASLAKLSISGGIKSIYPVATFSIPDIQPMNPQLATALSMTGADIAQSQLGLTGAGVRVGVIDSGIDYNHPDLGGGFGPGFRVATGFDFVGDAFTGSGGSTPSSNTPTPDLNPDDCNGHGTHVAGIIGASGNVTGVAPGITFGAYRVFGCTGSTSDDIVLAAMERALSDGMNVVNMSLGSYSEWPQSPVAAASDRLVNKGVVVAAAFGNVDLLYNGSAPAVGEKVIAVASVDDTLSRFNFSVSTGRQEDSI